MSKSYFIVHQVSYRYVRNVVDSIWRDIRRHAADAAEFHLAEAVDAVDVDADSTVFILGDAFQPFRRAAGVRYVFLNFSVLVMTGHLRDFSLGAYRLLSHKRKVLENKLGCFDQVLDYWPAQTAILRARLRTYGTPVDGFPVSLHPMPQSALKPLGERKYDVCFVGSSHARRSRVLGQLAAMGLSLSPSTGIDLEDAARESRILLNLHAYRSEHLETPRILGAFATRSALVTERCASVRGAFPAATHAAFGYAGLADGIKALLAQPDTLERIAGEGYRWLSEEHVPACERGWGEIVGRFAVDRQALAMA